MIDAVFGSFSDATIYFVMGAISSTIFIIRILLMSAFGMGDGGGDLDVDHGGDDHGHSGDAFHLFSTLSILAFMMGAGWMGVTCRLNWGLGPVAAALAAVGFGASMMLLTSFLLFQMRKLNASGSYDVRNCIGSTGRVYLRIPPRGEGTGQVEVNVDGRRSVYPAASNGEGIDSFVNVRVVAVDDDKTLIVERR